MTSDKDRREIDMPDSTSPMKRAPKFTEQAGEHGTQAKNSATGMEAEAQAQMLQSLTQATPLATACLDLDGNVRLWNQTSRTADSKGVELFTQFVHSRMDPSLIEQDTALKQAARYSGGIFRQFANIMQIAIDHAIEQGRSQVVAADVEFAANELRKGLMRIFTQKEMADLKLVYDNHDHPDRAQITPLFLLLAIIEYENDNFWYDVNPVLWPAFAGKP